LKVVIGAIQWPNPITLDLNCHGPLKKSHRDNEPLLFADFDQKPFQARQWPFLEPHPLPNIQKGTRFSPKARLHCSLESSNFPIVDGSGSSPDADKM
jgi:hypothetical protein